MQKCTVKPSLIALVVCDNIYREPGGKTALVGCFSDIATREVPVIYPRMAVCVSLTGLRENSHAKLEIVFGDDEDRPIFNVAGPVPEGNGPLSVVDMHFILENIKFEQEGTYFIRFWANGHVMAQRPFRVRVVTKKSK